jgi:hypothetical protein
MVDYVGILKDQRGHGLAGLGRQPTLFEARVVIGDFEEDE